VSGRRRELSRADRVLPGLWRLRLPLPWPGMPHVNAFAIAAGSGVVLVDTGLYEPGAMRQLERALDQARLRLEHVRLLVCTHAHSDHYGLAAPIADGAGCELLMHPNHHHMTKTAADPDRALDRRLEVARQSGVPADALARYEEAGRGHGFGIAEIVPPDRELASGVEVESDLGTWRVHETPGHAPSHAQLVLAGHGRPVRDARALAAANRRAVNERLDRVRRALDTGPRTAFQIVPELFDQQPSGPMMISRGLSEALCYLSHLELRGEVERVADHDPERWGGG
jgi:hypothetical protein